MAYESCNKQNKTSDFVFPRVMLKSFYTVARILICRVVLKKRAYNHSLANNAPFTEKNTYSAK